MKKVVLMIVLAIISLSVLLFGSSCKTKSDPAKPDFYNYWETNVPVPTSTSTPCVGPGGETCTPTSTPTPTPTLCFRAPKADISDQIMATTPTPVVGDTSSSPNSFDEGFYGIYGQDDIYTFTLSSPRTITVSLCGGAAWDTIIYIRTQCAVSSSTRYINDNYTGCGDQSRISQQYLSSGMYFLIVDGGLVAPNSGPYTIFASSVSAP